ncbi:MAG TPA: RNA polymerase sigma-70 factor [Puia sp.]|nr:RNA polymerase sigma-70 factor [Puia sp.]
MSILDEEVLTRLSREEPAALQLLIEAYFPILCRFAEKFLPDRSLAKDIVQEVFIKVWTNKPSFSNMASLKSYLFTLTRNGCLNMIRSREREEIKHTTAASKDPSTADPVLTGIVRAEYIAGIYQVVQTLPPKMQEIFYLSYEEGMTVRAIAQQLKMDVKAVRNQKYKALTVLRRRFNDSGEVLLVMLTYLLR